MIGYAVKTLFGVCALIAAVIAVLIAVLMGTDISIPASPMRQAFLDAASRAIGQEIQVEGEVRFAMSSFPALLVNDLHIRNRGQWQDEDMLRVGRARVQIALRPLLSGRLEFTEVSGDGIAINLEQRKDGQKNWLSHIVRPAHQGEPESDVDGLKRGRVGDDFVIQSFLLNDVTLSYRDDAMGRRFKHRIDQLNLSTQDRSRLSVRAVGENNGTAYSFSATSGLIRALLRGEAWHLDAEGEIDERPLTLSVDVETSAGELNGKLKLNAKQVNIGGLLNRLHITQGLNYSTDELTAEASLKGRSLDALINQSSFKLVLSNGNWKLGNHINDRFQNLRLNKVEMTAVEAENIQLIFDGSIANEAVQFTLHSNPLGAFFRGLDSVDVELDGRIAGARLKLQGDIKRPLSAKTIIFDMDVSGQRLDSWSNILGETLPPYGPYQLTGTFDMNPRGFHLSNIQSRVGESDLGGTIDIDITGARPLWKIDLLSKQFQLNDFLVEGYSMIPGKEGDAAVNVDSGIADSKRTDTQQALARQLEQRLSETHVIDRWDVDIHVQSKRVFSGKDLVGDGAVMLKGRQDTFDQDFKLTVPGGQVSGQMGITRDKGRVGGYFRLDMDRFDYGIFLRRLKPENKTDGLASAKVDVKLSGPSYARRFDDASGTLDFAIWPENIDAEEMDFWAVNVFFSMLPPLSEDKSKVNCVLSLLDINEGIMKEQFFAVDSSKVWLNGNLDVNFRDQSIDLGLYPKPKKPRIFALETPIHIKGDFSKQEMSIEPEEMVGSVISFIFSPLHVPLRRIFGNKVPTDASQKCAELLDREVLESLK